MRSTCCAIFTKSPDDGRCFATVVVMFILFCKAGRTCQCASVSTVPSYATRHLTICSPTQARGSANLNVVACHICANLVWATRRLSVGGRVPNTHDTATVGTHTLAISGRIVRRKFHLAPSASQSGRCRYVNFDVSSLIFRCFFSPLPPSAAEAILVAAVSVAGAAAARH